MAEIEKVEAEASQALVPLLGLVIDLDQPKQVAEALYIVRDAKRQLDEARAGLERVLAEEARRLGTKTLHLDGVEAVITGGPTVEYDIEELQKLLDAGLPEERYDKLVKAKVEYVVDKSVIRQLLGSGNAEYLRIIERAARDVEKPYRVSVR